MECFCALRPTSPSNLSGMDEEPSTYELENSEKVNCLLDDLLERAGSLQPPTPRPEPDEIGYVV